jgi:hypothetical protein
MAEEQATDKHELNVDVDDDNVNLSCATHLHPCSSRGWHLKTNEKAGMTPSCPIKIKDL